MSILSRLRVAYHNRHFSTILSPNSSTPLTSKEKTRAALSLIKSEKNPEKILEICRAVSLTPDTHLDRVAFSVAISKLSEFKHFEGIRQFIDDLKTRPDLKTERFASHAIVLYGQANMIDHAIRSFKQMDELGIPRSVKSLNALLFACILAKDYKQGVKPNSTTFGTFLAGCYKEAKFEDVGKVLKLMEKGMKPNSVTFCHLIHGFCKEGKLDEAKSLFKNMVNRGIQPDSDCYFTLVYFLCQGGDFETALRICKESMAKGWVPNFSTMKTLVDGLASILKVELAKELIKQIKEKVTKNTEQWDEIESALPSKEE
ncbi:Pentatricopeptide repeat-containing protein [Quillaja saponaria]|uniref:Pentatricopeptide repeat-containing protein n=1 Tax=Quillaja saponaria TaxID=32244 RepID=A0AAD7M0E1_QUISA|nr:Pentatricopeptide repeat-containing protein [Quillaja saponaria]